VTSTIIGATTMEQLKENIDSIQVSLSDEILKAIDEVQAIIPDPAPNKLYSYNIRKARYLVIWIGLLF
jgi:diketogulonate reductase-like aldo/keto reductase